MRRGVTVVALAAALWGGAMMPVAAQTNGIVIQNNGVDDVSSAAGADNVRISQNPGTSQSANGAGSGNEERRAVREAKDRDRGNRGGDAAPVEAAPAEAAPAEGDYQAYGDEGTYVDPAAAPQEIAAPAGDEVAPVKLPNTGAGGGALPWAALVTAMAGAFGVLGARLRTSRG